MTRLIMSRPEKAEPGAYGEPKKYKQFMITESASLEVDRVAYELGITRSEVIERAIRCGGLAKAQNFNPETGKCDKNCSLE
ncbi:MAG: hypothetical protein QNJ54_27240 [Prochloraceae cyanobacterium]|nr:hypothetical protein [Prochloraceae cyanobacterium]